MAEPWALAQALRDTLGGAGEVAGTIGSGMVAQPLAGLYGAGTFLRHLGKGKDEAVRRASENIEQAQQAMTYQPRGDVGRRGLENIGKVIDPISTALRENIADPVGNVSPLLGAALVALPDALPGPGKVKVPKVKGATKAAALPAAPQDEAMRVAQVNAAKPVSKGGLGLGKNNTPMERAAAMGYDLERPLYHGSLHDIKNVDLDRSSTEGHAGRGFYMTPSAEDASINYATPYGPDPKGKISNALDVRADDRNQARTYRAFDEQKLSPERLEKVVRGTDTGEHLGAVYPVYAKHGAEANLVEPKRSRYLEEGQVYNEKLDDYEPGPMAGKWENAVRTMEDFGAKTASDKVYDMVLEGARADEVAKRLRGIEGYHPDTGTGTGPYGVATEVLRDLGVNTFTHPTSDFRFPLNIAPSHTVALQPSGTVRSRFAAFDPARADSSDILGHIDPKLAVALGAGAGATALAAPAAAEKLRERRERRNSASRDRNE